MATISDVPIDLQTDALVEVEKEPVVLEEIIEESEEELDADVDEDEDEDSEDDVGIPTPRETESEESKEEDGDGETVPRVPFALPTLQEMNEDDCWGPSFIPSEMQEVVKLLFYQSPFQTKFFFPKKDKQAAKVDWYNIKPFEKKYMSKIDRQRQRGQELYFEGEKTSDEFQFVESKLGSEAKASAVPLRLNTYQRSRAQQAQRQQRQLQQRQQQQRQRNFVQTIPQREREASISVRDEWVPITTLEFAGIAKSTGELPVLRELLFQGVLHEFAKPHFPQMKISTQSELTKRVSIFEDEIIKSYIADADIFIPADVFASLATVQHSVMPWHYEVRNIGGKIFIDTMDKESVRYYVHENSYEPPSETPPENVGARTVSNYLNTQPVLVTEAASLNAAFKNAVLGETTYTPNPEEPACEGGCYRYRLFELREQKLRVLVRAYIAGYKKNMSGDHIFFTPRALLEYDPSKTKWANSLQNSLGQTLLAEMKNNVHTHMQWCFEALLAGVNEIYFGFATRAKSNSNQEHDILLVKSMGVSDVSNQLSLRQHTCWLVGCTALRTISKLHENSVGVFMKEPNKNASRLYKIRSIENQ